MLKKKSNLIILLVLISFSFLNNFIAAQDLSSRFPVNKKLDYDVYFNGLKVGTFNWEYAGEGKILGKDVYILLAKANTSIIGIFDLLNSEEIFLDQETFLPLKVERDLVYFGRKEVIEEFYDQQQGTIKIVKNNNINKTQILNRNIPIQNILTLIYFFPKDIKLQEGINLDFNLPTQKLSIKVMPSQFVNTAQGKVEAFFLTGKGARNFNLWLDKKDRLPIRLESGSFLNRVAIVRKTN